MKFLQVMRPLHWTKNMFVFAALVFGRKLNDSSAILSAIIGFFCFCLASSAVYILNDIIDRKRDRLHPEKSQRPIAAGSLKVDSALILSILCTAVSIIVSYILNPTFVAIILIYIVLMVLYSLLLRKVMILDCVVISTGFCLRAIAGAVVVQVEFISPWLIICTFALCLFLAFGKRRSEIALLQEDSELFRVTLAGYTPELLAHMIDVTSGLAVVCFLLYAMDDKTFQIHGSNNLVYTTPLVLYCIFRFSSLIQMGKYSGPVQLIFRDLPFQIGFILWVIASVVVIYSNKLGLF